MTTMTTMITIRDGNFRVAARGDTVRVVAAHPAAVERIDFFIKGRQIGVTWVDGASTIFDIGFPEAMRRWAREWAASMPVAPQIVEH